MIELTRFNETKFTLNAEIIEMVEETPDTVITLTTGKKIIVKESRQEVANLVKLYRYEIMSGSWLKRSLDERSDEYSGDDSGNDHGDDSDDAPNKNPQPEHSM